jgi:hypothetical protein
VLLMPSELLTYSDLASRLQISPEAARSLVKRHRWPKSRANDGKTLVTVDLAEIRHTPLPARSPGGHHPDAIAVTTALETKIETLQAELARLEATASGHRADFERERDRAEKLMVELLRATMEAAGAREDRARLQGELTAMQARARSWWWRRLAG